MTTWSISTAIIRAAEFAALMACGVGCQPVHAQSQFVPGFVDPTPPIVGQLTSDEVDLNNDGATDTCGVFGNVFWILIVRLNDGSGRFRMADVWMPLAWQYFWFAGGSPGLVDVDDDGDIDVFVKLGPTVINTTGTPFAVCLINDGAGSFTLDASDRFGGFVFDEFHRLRAGDFDGDGRGDVLVLHGGTGMVLRLFRNVGSGQFREVPGAFPPQSAPYYLAETLVVDIDADGDVDILAATLGNAIAPLLFLNDGTGHFYHGFAFTGIESESVAVGDVNGDGHSDILFGSTNPVSLLPELWIADGQGAFLREDFRFPPLWPAFTFWPSIQFGDLDHDGDVDLFMIEANARFLVNDGNGYFTDGTAALGLSGLRANVWIGDVDRDGDNDVVTAASLAWNIPTYLNTLRQIITNDPLVGGSLDVDLYARPGHIVTYLLGFARRDLQLPGIGWYALHPATVVAWPSAAVVDPTGHFRTSLTVPNNPALRGVALFAQGVEVDTQAQVTLMSVWPFTIR